METYQASGLLAYPPNTQIEPYKVNPPNALSTSPSTLTLSFRAKSHTLVIRYSLFVLETVKKLIYTRQQLLKIYRPSTPKTDGTTSATSSSNPTTRYSHSPNARFYTSLFAPVSPRSKPRLATPNTQKPTRLLPPPRPTTPRTPPPPWPLPPPSHP